MVKRSIIVMGLIFAMMGIFMADALASLTFSGGGKFKVGSYFAEAGIKGGAKPTIINESFLLTAIEPIDAYIACTNGGKWDVRDNGGGGTTIYQITDLATGSEGLGDREQGRFYVSTHPICWTVDENLVKDCDNVIFEGSDTVEPVTSANCRNLNWDPYQYLMQTLKLSGALEICEEGVCSTGEELVYFCETKTPTNIRWVADPDICDPSTDSNCVCELQADGTNFCTNVTYLCWDFGSPIAWDDSYITRSPLRVRAPGVLSNDHDTCDATTDSCTQLTATPVADAANGHVDLNSDGSFTYTPNAGFSGPVDFFTYKAVDAGGHESNVATVTINFK